MASTWIEILEQVQAIQREAVGEGTPLWYRGQRLATWTLESTIHRHIDRSLEALHQNPPEDKKLALMRSVSISLFHKFKNQSWPLLDPQERSKWGILFAMQHYGLPTRLMDWTRNFACALYFAQLHRKPQDDAAIFILKPEKLNQQAVGIEGIASLGEEVNMPTRVDMNVYHPAVTDARQTASDMETVAVAPVITNARMVAQSAAFTLSGASFLPMEERYIKCIRKIVLPTSAFHDAEQFLAMVGSSHFHYFPDLDGLRQELVNELEREMIAARQQLRIAE